MKGFILTLFSFFIGLNARAISQPYEVDLEYQLGKHQTLRSHQLVMWDGITERMIETIDGKNVVVKFRFDKIARIEDGRETFYLNFEFSTLADDGKTIIVSNPQISSLEDEKAVLIIGSDNPDDYLMVSGRVSPL